MAVKVTLSNNEVLTIHRDTVISAWKGTNNKDKNGQQTEYYAESIYSGSASDGKSLATADQRVALQGLFSNSDWFAIDSDPHKLYQSSAVVSIED